MAELALMVAISAVAACRLSMFACSASKSDTLTWSDSSSPILAVAESRLAIVA